MVFLFWFYYGNFVMYRDVHYVCILQYYYLQLVDCCYWIRRADVRLEWNTYGLSHMIQYMLPTLTADKKYNKFS